MPLRRLDMYVCVSDMDRAADFYRGLFQSEPSLVTPTYTGFQLNGALFGLLSQEVYGSDQPVVRGNSTMVNVLVEDIDAEFDRVRALKPRNMTDSVRSIGPYRMFIAADPDGNLIEFYEVVE